MESLISSIKVGVAVFPFFAVLFTVPILFIQAVRYRTVNIFRIGLNYIFLLYVLCFAALVFLPLPTLNQAAKLTTHDMQLIPFHFILDIIKDSPLQITNWHTYLPALTDQAISQVIFNVLLVVPFGMFVRYYFHMKGKSIVALSLALSLFVEIAQLTGLFFLFSGSYRLCDVDDLIMNTLGGYLGYQVVKLVEAYIPAIETFDFRLFKVKKIETI